MKKLYGCDLENESIFSYFEIKQSYSFIYFIKKINKLYFLYYGIKLLNLKRTSEKAMR